jgi:hypothetical protein
MKEENENKDENIEYEKRFVEFLQEVFQKQILGTTDSGNRNRDRNWNSGLFLHREPNQMNEHVFRFLKKQMQYKENNKDTKQKQKQKKQNNLCLFFQPKENEKEKEKEEEEEEKEKEEKDTPTEIQEIITKEIKEHLLPRIVSFIYENYPNSPIIKRELSAFLETIAFPKEIAASTSFSYSASLNRIQFLTNSIQNLASTFPSLIKNKRPFQKKQWLQEKNQSPAFSVACSTEKENKKLTQCMIPPSTVNLEKFYTSPYSNGLRTFLEELPPRCTILLEFVKRNSVFLNPVDDATTSLLLSLNTYYFFLVLTYYVLPSDNNSTNTLNKQPKEKMNKPFQFFSKILHLIPNT